MGVFFGFMGNFSKNSSNNEAAERWYSRELEIDPKSDNALLGLGILCRRKKDYASAMEFYRKALEVNPSDGHTHSSIGVIYIIQQRHDQALDELLYAIELFPADPVINANLAMGYHNKGDYVNRDIYIKRAEALGYDQISKLRELFSYQEGVAHRFGTTNRVR